MGPKLYLALWYVHRPQSYDMGTPFLRPVYIPYSCMEPLAKELGLYQAAQIKFLSPSSPTTPEAKAQRF